MRDKDPIRPMKLGLDGAKPTHCHFFNLIEDLDSFIPNAFIPCSYVSSWCRLKLETPRLRFASITTRPILTVLLSNVRELVVSSKKQTAKEKVECAK